MQFWRRWRLVYGVLPRHFAVKFKSLLKKYKTLGGAREKIASGTQCSLLINGSPTTILAKSLGTLSQKHRKFAHSASTPYAMLIWSALHTQNHCGRFQHCWGRKERELTKRVWYKQSNRLTQGVFHKCPSLCVCLPGVPTTFGQDCSFLQFRRLPSPQISLDPKLSHLRRYQGEDHCFCCLLYCPLLGYRTSGRLPYKSCDITLSFTTPKTTLYYCAKTICLRLLLGMGRVEIYLNFENKRWPFLSSFGTVS